MEKELGKEIQSDFERRKFLEDNCDSVVEMGYMKTYSADHIAGLKERLAENSIEVETIEIEKKAAADQFKVQLKPLKTEHTQLLKGIREKAEYVNESCYKFIDRESKMVGFYNASGDLVESRPARPNELQGTIQQLLRTGTNN